MLTFQTKKEPIGNDQSALFVAPSGSFDKMSSRQFKKQLQDYLSVGFRFIVLDCKNIRSVSSTALQILLEMVESYQAAGGIFLFLRVQPTITHFFDKLGFSPIFTSFTTDQEAVEYLSAQVKAMFEKSSSDKSLHIKATFGDPSSDKSPPVKDRSKAATGRFRPKLLASSASIAVPNKDLSVTVQLSYYRQMRAFDLFPLKLEVSCAQKSDETLIIIPHLPGCLMVPDHRILGFAQDNNYSTFWVTPLVAKKINGWIEVWRGESMVYNLKVNPKCSSANTSKWLFAVGALVLLLPAMSKTLPSVDSLLQQVSPVTQGNWALAILLWLLAICSYLQSLPRKVRRTVEIIFKDEV